MNSTLKQYNITFSLTNLRHLQFAVMSSINGTLSGFVSNWQTSSEVESAIKATNRIFTGQVEKIINTTDSIETINIDISCARFYDNPNFDDNSAFFSLPTTDFLLILMEWKEFLRSNGK